MLRDYGFEALKRLGTMIAQFGLHKDGDMRGDAAQGDMGLIAGNDARSLQPRQPFAASGGTKMNLVGKRRFGDAPLAREDRQHRDIAFIQFDKAHGSFMRAQVRLVNCHDCGDHRDHDKMAPRPRIPDPTCLPFTRSDD